VTDEQRSIRTYVSDMLALERHVRVPFETQTKSRDVAKFSQAEALVRRLEATSQQHVDELDDLLEELGGHTASPAKSAVTQFEGAIASAIDSVRKTKVSKDLRDDYTALALCAAGYTMLHATATALGESSVAEVAEDHLRDYAQLIVEIGQALPGVVIAELGEIGLSVDPVMAEPARRAVEHAWRGANAGTESVLRGTIESERTPAPAASQRRLPEDSVE